MPIHGLNNRWILETDKSAYVFAPMPNGLLTHLYWGARLPYPADYPTPDYLEGWASFNGAGQTTPEEYPTYGGYKFVEPCLKLTFADGVRGVELRFDGAETLGTNTLLVRMKDTHYPLLVTLRYVLHEEIDVIERSAEITNTGDQPVVVERAFSALWHLPHGDTYRLTHFTGKWAGEWVRQRDHLTPGVKVLESRRITTSHHHAPYFAIDYGNSDEDLGEVWFGALAWSGNWKLTAEVTDFRMTRVGIGLNDWDFMWTLTPGETFSTPPAYAGYTRSGFGGASRRMHRLVRAGLPHPDQPRKVLYNSWEATLFDINVAQQIELAERAAEMGVELFVMDDGWFKGRNDDTAGLGDWTPDAKKFPDGLTPLIEKVNALGMEFGLWLEPEMINPNSDLYRAHPDWVIHFPTRQRTEARNQLILNLARTDVQDHLIDVIDSLLKNHRIAFIKWDMNRNVSEPGNQDASGGRELWVRYVQGVYRVWGELRKRHPMVIWQSCSGGGGRADLGILRYADQIWISDNTEATARLPMQENFSHMFPANTMEAWVTDMNPLNLPMDFRCHVSMCGILSVGGHLLRWSEADRNAAKRWIALYKEIRSTIQFGDLYRLRSAVDEPFSALLYVRQDQSEGVLFVFRTHIPDPTNLPPIYLRGLNPDARYEVQGFGTRSGAAWMRAGVPVFLSHFESKVIKIRRV